MHAEKGDDFVSSLPSCQSDLWYASHLIRREGITMTPHGKPMHTDSYLGALILQYLMTNT